MASTKTVTAENLTALGVERLANLLVGLAEERADIKRRLRLELAGKAGGEAIAAETGKRLTSLKSARSFIDWEKRREFVKELDLLRETITERVAETTPDLALDLMWRFLELAEPILQRVDDSNGTVGGVFHLACGDLGTIAAKARPNPAVMANKIFAAVTSNDYGQYDGLIQMIFPVLGKTGVAHLKARLSEALAKRPKDNQTRHDSHASRLTHAL